MFRFALLILLLCFAVACGGSDKPSSSSTGGGSSSTAADDEDDDEGVSVRQKYTADKGTATVKGTVRFEGTARRRVIDMGAEKYCVNCYQDGAKPKSETVVVGENGELANVFISVTKGLKNWKFAKGSGDVNIDQKQCMYVPHVTGMQTGQTLKIKNSDPIMHNIHATDSKRGEDWFNEGQPVQGQVFSRDVTDAGTYKLKCDVHGWMAAYICVVKNPFYAVSGTDGAFALDKLPAGTYTIQAWHEKYGTQTQEVTVKDGETATISFTFKK